MIETLKNIIDSYRSGRRSTPNIQVIGKTLSDETIKFPGGLIADQTFASSTFRSSKLINMEFINANFESCHFMQPIFEDVNFGSAVLKDSKFSNFKKSIEFEGEVYFINIFDQIDKFLLDEE